MASISAESAASAAPVAKAARIDSLDILRGVAVFGILMMNITAFGLLWQAYNNPTVDGGADGLNLAVYKIINVGFEGTMRGIFSLLFGAGIVLLTERMELAGAGIMAAEVHFRRMLWMLLFGFAHWALLLWTGEILFAYSICGLILFSFRKLKVGVLLSIAAAMLLVASAASVGRWFDTSDLSARAAAAETAKASGAKLTAKQDDAIKDWKEEAAHSKGSPEDAAKRRAWHSGSYVDAVTGQFPGSVEFQWVGLPFALLFDMLPFMLIGMALLKIDVLSGLRPRRDYLIMLVAGYGIGLPLGYFELQVLLDANFTRLAFLQADATYQISRLAMVVGHLGLLLTLIGTGWLGPLQRALGAVGQMALTNYLMQTIICTWLFYSFGPGLGLFGQLERYQLYGVVAAIWLAQLLWSPLWLSKFRFGPFEWIWRSLTYWQKQPMRI